MLAQFVRIGVGAVGGDDDRDDDLAPFGGRRLRRVGQLQSGAPVRPVVTQRRMVSTALIQSGVICSHPCGIDSFAAPLLLPYVGQLPASIGSVAPVR